MKTLTRTLFAAGVAALLGTAAQAQVTTDPYLFETPSFGAADGTFEWDTFAGSFAGTHATDVGTTGTGSAVLDTTGFSGGFDPPALITSSSNLYTGSHTGTYAIDLTGLENAGAMTTVVLQIAYIPGAGPFASSVQLEGLDATEFVDRGIAAGVEHGLVASPNDTAYLWAEWQVGSASAYTLTFDSDVHTNLAAVRVDYINSGSAVDAVAPAAVPEPSALALLLGGAALYGVRRRR